MDGFAQFVPDGGELDPEAIRGAGLAARPFPELAGTDEIVAVGRQVGAERMELWIGEHRREPQHLTGRRLDTAALQSLVRCGSNVLVAFERARTYLWQPLEHEFFVIFGPRLTLEAIRSAGIFTYDYDDYAREPYFAGERSEFLIETGRRYTIG